MAESDVKVTFLLTGYQQNVEKLHWNFRYFDV